MSKLKSETTITPLRCSYLCNGLIPVTSQGLAEDVIALAGELGLKGYSKMPMVEGTEVRMVVVKVAKTSDFIGLEDLEENPVTISEQCLVLDRVVLDPVPRQL